MPTPKESVSASRAAIPFGEGWSAVGRSHLGLVRTRNEDQFVIAADLGLCAVADGLGGGPAGDVASRLACDTLVAKLRAEQSPDKSGEAAALRRAVEASDRAVVEAGRGDQYLRGMGTTLSAIRLPHPETAGRAWIAHVGDSRIYVLRAAGLQQVSLDHSVAMGWVRDEFMTLEEAKRSPYWHYLSQALGGVEPVRPQTEEVGLADAVAILLCSDGLSDMVGDDAIETILSAHPGDAAAAAEALVETALENGGEDNVTVVAIARTDDETAR